MGKFKNEEQKNDTKLGKIAKPGYRNRIINKGTRL